MPKLTNKYLTFEILEQKTSEKYGKAKWIMFAEELLKKGFRVSLYEARRTFSKYLTVEKDGEKFKVRFSNHKPNKEREEHCDCDFFVGVSNYKVTTTEDAFNAVYPFYAYSAITAPHPHNLYLVIMTETGIVGTVAFVLIILLYYKKLFGVIRYSEDKNLKLISSGLVAAMSGFLLQGMFDNVWYNYRVFLLFWIYIALGAVVDVVSRRSEV